MIGTFFRSRLIGSCFKHYLDVAVNFGQFVLLPQPHVFTHPEWLKRASDLIFQAEKADMLRGSTLAS